jgi:hypothetical protein
MIERKAVKNNDPEINFWECNPELKAISVFKEFYSSDKSKGKSYSSNIMWYVYFITDNSTIFANIPFEERVELFRSDYVDKIKDVEKIKEDKLESLCDFYKKITETPAMRQMRIWEKKMDEKTKLMETTPYTLDTAEILDKMIKSNVDAFKSYEMIMKQLATEDTSTVAKGGGTRSLTDSGEI